MMTSAFQLITDCKIKIKFYELKSEMFDIVINAIKTEDECPEWMYDSEFQDIKRGRLSRLSADRLADLCEAVTLWSKPKEMTHLQNISNELY